MNSSSMDHQLLKDPVAQKVREHEEISILRVDLIQGGSPRRWTALRSDIAQQKRSGAKTAAERKAAQRERDAADGLKQLNIKVPVQYHGILKEFAKALVSGGDEIEKSLAVLDVTISGNDFRKAAMENGHRIDELDRELGERITECIELEGRLQSLKDDMEYAKMSAEAGASDLLAQLERVSNVAKHREDVLAAAKRKIRELEVELATERRRSWWRRLLNIA